MMAEECAELAKEILKMHRKSNGSTWNKIIEETVDVEIMVNQLKTVFRTKTYEQIKEKKLTRLNKMLNESR